MKRFVVYNDHLTGIFRARPLEVSGMYGNYLKSQFCLFYYLFIQGNPIPITNWILDTDYKTFAVRFSCYNVSDTSHRKSKLRNRTFYSKINTILYFDRGPKFADSSAVSKICTFKSDTNCRLPIGFLAKNCFASKAESLS